MDTIFTITDLETLKVISEPLRAQLVEVLVAEPLTVKQVADKLGLAVSKLYYHVNLLEKHGLIQVVDTRIVSGIIEKQYRAVASKLDVDKNLLNFATDEGKETINAIINSTIDLTREDLLRSLQARYFELEQQTAVHRPRAILITRELSRIPDERADEFIEQLNTLIKSFGNEDTNDSTLRTYALTIAFYPSFYFKPEDEK